MTTQTHDYPAVFGDRQHVAVGGGRVAFREAGRGTPLVLLHGVSSNADSFAFQLAGLAGWFRVIAWDMPGYGGSDRLSTIAGSGGTAPADYAAALAGLLDALGVARCHLLGHSLGALVAAAFARRERGRIDRLILADCALGYGEAPGAPLSEKMQARIDTLARLGVEGNARERTRHLLSAEADEVAIAHVRRVAAALRPDGYGDAVHALAQGDIRADLGEIDVPTLFLCGGGDTVTPPDSVAALVPLVADAQWRLLPELGHACYIDDPDAFNVAVADFLCT